MRQYTKYVGLDVHTDSITVALTQSDGKEPALYGQLANTPEAVDKLARQLSRQAKALPVAVIATPAADLWPGLKLLDNTPRKKMLRRQGSGTA